MLAIFFMIFISGGLFAQSRTVKGYVKDSYGEPVVGAVVMQEGSRSNGAVTDGKGAFTLTLSDKIKSTDITVSCLSYKTATVTPAEGMNEIVLEDDTMNIEETVVIGYGSMRKSDITGSVTSVKIDENKAAQSLSLDQLILGNAPGVQVVYNGGSPDAGVAMRIRGTSSLNGSNEPLYVIDGVIANNPSETPALLDDDETEEVNNLLGINPQDIESIEILKDASATAIYGANGANGVVLITTKKAVQDRPSIKFSVGYDLAKVSKRMDVMSTEEYVNFLREVLYRQKDEYASTYLEKYDEGKYTDVNWQDYAFRVAPRQRYYLNISGRPNNIAYNFSLGYNSTQGIVKNTGSDQLTARMNVSKTFWKKLELNAKVNFSTVSTSNQQSANSSSQNANTSFITSIQRYRPLMPVTPEDEEEDDDELNDPENRSSPARWLNDAYTNRVEYRVIPSLSLEYKPVKWLSIKSAIGGDYKAGERSQWKGITVNRSADGALGVLNYTEGFHWNWDNTVTAKNKWGKHNLTTTAGVVFGKSGSKVDRVYGNNIKQYTAGIDNINSAENLLMSYSESFYSELSFLARAIYNYDERYILTATYRADGSSKFTDSNKFGHFPSFALAWRINQEPWFNIPVVSMAKLRAGWGLVGNANVSNYQTYVTYDSINYANHFNGSGYKKGVLLSTFANRDLRWESANQVNLGLDLGLWDGRFTLTVDAYRKVITDLLQQRDVPHSSGYSTLWMNTGSIENKGLEFALQTVPLKIGDFVWTIDGNLSFNRNTLMSFGFDANNMEMWFPDGSKSTVNYVLGATLGKGDYFLGNTGNIFVEGMPLGMFYGYLTDGIVQLGETGPGLAEGEVCNPGQVKYVDLNGNGYIDEYDRTIIGDSNPDFTYGFSSNLSFKGLTFSIQFQGEQGKDILYASRNMLLDSNNPKRMNFLREAYYDAWSETNPTNDHIALFGANTNQHRYLTTDRYVEDASYLRLSNISLNYSFKMPKNAVVKGLSVGVAGQNVYVWTKYSGWDPNVSTYLNNMKKVGVDSGAYPSARTICFDLKFNF